MAELGENAGSGDPGKSPWDAPSMGHDITAGGSNIPPWRRPEVWQQPANNNMQQQGYRPPQAGYGAGYGAGGAYAAGGQWAGYPGGYQQPQDYANYSQYYSGQYAQ